LRRAGIQVDEALVVDFTGEGHPIGDVEGGGEPFQPGAFGTVAGDDEAKAARQRERAQDEIDPLETLETSHR